MNNKGFAITSIIYGLMLLFVMIVASFISVLVGRNRRMDDLLDSVRESVSYSVVNICYNNYDNYFYVNNNNNNSCEYNEKAYDSAGAYVTEKKGKYIFKFSDDSTCVVYLPKNTAIISEFLKESGAIGNNLYYIIGGSDDVNDFSGLNCIGF